VTAGDWKRRLEEWLSEGAFATIIPEVAALIGVPQPPEFHPEGDALTHTLQAVAEVDDRDDERVFWAVLLHDIGKKSTTVFHDGRWRAHGHADESALLAQIVLVRCGLGHLAADVVWLVKNHHFKQSWNLKPGTSLSRHQQRFTELPLFHLLENVCAADAAGRKINGKSP
jgi:hypothetical protein